MVSSQPDLCVIIPTLNEADTLATLLAQLAVQVDVSLEVIVADGGSTDDTLKIATEFNILSLRCPQGRGIQMNTAVKQTSSPWLLFLHADSSITDPNFLKEALNFIYQAPQKTAGHFALKFLRKNKSKNQLAFQYMEEKTRFNLPNTTNGDQGLLIHRDFFQALGGFNEELPFLEDQELAERIREQGQWVTLPGVLATSARRFEVEGHTKRYILMSLILGVYNSNFKEFITAVPELYREQSATKELHLSVFLKKGISLLQQKTPHEKNQFWWQIGSFVKGNSWQLFFFWDVFFRKALGPGRYPCKRFHDMFIWPLIDFRILDRFTGFLVYLWFRWCLYFYYRVSEKSSYNL